MIKPKIITQYPIAYESHDHIEPKGTANDNTKNGAYVRELIRRFGTDMKYMDLGCAGGGFVAQFLNNGVFAVGVEGSDYCLKNQRSEWTNHPDYLFTADITKEFKILNEEGERIKFDAISAFDVLEHIKKDDLPNLLNNVLVHLKYGGHFIVGIATFPDEGYHVTLEDETWWDGLMRDYSLRRIESMENIGRSTSINAVYEKFEQ